MPSPHYAIGAAQRQAVLPGRADVELSLAEVLADIEAGRRPRNHGIVGSRGMGKTTLLNKFADSAMARRHPVIMMRGNFDDADSLMAQLAVKTVQLARKVRPIHRRTRHALKSSVTEITATLHLGVVSAAMKADPNRDAATSRSLVFAAEEALQMVSNELARHERGLVVMVDEAHAASPSDLRLITGLMQSISERHRNVALVLAGLSSLHGAAAGSSFTFMERYAWFDLEPLTLEQTGHALRQPLEYQGRMLTDDAVAKAWDLSQGHPHVVQLVARHAERAAQGSPAGIEAGHVDVAAQVVRRELAATIYRARWNAMNDEEKSLVRALAVVQQETGMRLVPIDRVARAMDRTPREILDLAVGQDTFSVLTRSSSLRFDVPGMGAWALEHHPAVSNHKVAALHPQVRIPRAVVSSDEEQTGGVQGAGDRAPGYQRLSLLIEQRARRAELGLGIDPVLEAEWARVLQQVGGATAATGRFTRARRPTPGRTREGGNGPELG